VIYTPITQASGWTIIETENYGVHIMPVDEMDMHDFENCRCEPREDEGVIIHASFDGRELYERGERKPS
jgi:hypothetical protein